ncbi:MAG: cell division protein SepF [Clostridiales bacterium]|jgi:FtsZ-interacting cell division protein YlmF|nr:cell division protein SepF [Clostridiales bacterium]
MGVLSELSERAKTFLDKWKGDVEYEDYEGDEDYQEVDDEEYEPVQKKEEKQNHSRTFAKKEYEIKTSKPKTVDDAPAICDLIRAGKIVLVTITDDISRGDGVRIMDVLSGAAYALHATVQKLDVNNVFAIAPEGCSISEHKSSAYDSDLSPYGMSGLYLRMGGKRA